MKYRSLLAVVFVLVAVWGWALRVEAGDKGMQAAAGSVQPAACPHAHGSGGGEATAAAAAMPAGEHGACAAKMAAACAAQSAKVGCGHMKGGSAGGTHDCAGKGAPASHGVCCTSKGAKSASALQGGCPMHGTAAAGAMALAAGGGACGRGVTRTAEMSAQMECDACADMAACEEVLKANGAQAQVVPLRNGVMFVYTTDTPARVRAVQEALARRAERFNAMPAAGDKVKLCPACKMIRGAIASGKLTRETVNIEGGCLTLMTSSDPALVAKLLAMAGVQNGNRKS